MRKVEYEALVKAVKELKGVPIHGEDGGPQFNGGLEKISASDKMDEDEERPETPESLPELPESLPAGWELNLDLLKQLHLVLQDIIVEEGTLVCPESGREFPIERGIPNMLLHDDEI